MGGNQFHVALGEDLRDDAEIVFLARLGEHSQAFLGQPLEFVRRGPGLEGTAPQERRPLRLDCLGRRHELLLALHRAGSCHEAKLLSRAYLLSVHRDDGVRTLFRLAAGQLVALLHPVNVLHLGPRRQGLQRLMGILVPNGRDHGLDVTVDGPGLVTELGDFRDDFFDLGRVEVGLEYDDHKRVPGGKIRKGKI